MNFRPLPSPLEITRLYFFTVSISYPIIVFKVLPKRVYFTCAQKTLFISWSVTIQIYPILSFLMSFHRITEKKSSIPTHFMYISIPRRMNTVYFTTFPHKNVPFFVVNSQQCSVWECMLVTNVKIFVRVNELE